MSAPPPEAAQWPFVPEVQSASLEQSPVAGVGQGVPLEPVEGEQVVAVGRCCFGTRDEVSPVVPSPPPSFDVESFELELEQARRAKPAAKASRRVGCMRR